MTPIRRTLKHTTVVAALAASLAAGAWAQDADYVFTNAKVYTVNEAQPWAEALQIVVEPACYGDPARPAND